jgi:hypothetical protein
MHGNLSWNMVIASISSALTFLVSITSNLLTTALLQSLYAFGIMFLVAFIFRFLVGLLISINIPMNTDLDLTPQDDETYQDETGRNISLSTPDADEYLQDIIKQNYTNNDENNSDSFQPLNPTRLSSAPETQADPLVEAVRSTMRQE